LLSVYGKGKSDEVISETLSIPECHVKTYRSILGLAQARRSAFVNPRKISYDDNTEKFTMSSMQIPFEVVNSRGYENESKKSNFSKICLSGQGGGEFE
jgi:hypothetical protein